MSEEIEIVLVDDVEFTPYGYVGNGKEDGPVLVNMITGEVFQTDISKGEDK